MEQQFKALKHKTIENTWGWLVDRKIKKARSPSTFSKSSEIVDFQANGIKNLEKYDLITITINY